MTDPRETADRRAGPVTASDRRLVELVRRVLAIAVVIAAGCAPTIPPASTAAPPSSSAPSLSIPAASTTQPAASGGTLKVGMYMRGYERFQRLDDGRRNTTWDPQGTWAYEPWGLFRCCLLRTLLSYNGRSVTEGGSIFRPDLAAGDPDISADGLTWTFRLKPGIHYAPPFADTTIVAGDIIRALERTLRDDPFDPNPEGALGGYPFFYSDVIVGAEDFHLGKVSSISGLEAPDPQTLVVRLIKPTGDLGSRFALPATAPIPAGAADAHDDGYGPYLVSSGPYMIEGVNRTTPASGYVAGKSLTLVRNPSWDRSTDGLRLANVDRIEVSDLVGPSEVDGGLQLVRDGKLDLVLDSDLSPDEIAKIQAQPSLADRLHTSPGPNVRWIPMNLAQPPFDDIHVRRAMNFAANKAELARVFDPTARVATHAVPDSMEAGLLADYDPYRTPDHLGSIEKAKAEIAKSKYDSNHDGVCDAAVCKGVTTLVRMDDRGFLAQFESLSRSVAPLGLTLRAKRFSGPQGFFGVLIDPTSHTPLAIHDGWSADFLNASNWFAPLALGSNLGRDPNSSLIGASPAQLREWGYKTTSVPSIDDKINDCLARAGLSQDTCWAEADQFFMERVVPWIPLLSGQLSRLTSDRVVGFTFDLSTTMPALDQISLR